MSLQARRYSPLPQPVVDPVSDLFWEAMEAANDRDDDEYADCYCEACGGLGSDREYEERVSWEQHRAEEAVTSVWYAAHHAHAGGRVLARFVVHVTFGSSSA